jgi:hypothetical protein
MNINLEHTVDEINLIIKALEEMPHKLVHALLVKIHNQAIPQTHAPTDVAPAETDTK